METILNNPGLQHLSEKVFWNLDAEKLAPLTDNPNAPNQYGRTPILEAAYLGFTEIVKILVPMTPNPNAPDKHGNTPINTAMKYGYTDIVKILAPLTENPNALNKDGQTLSSVAKNAEI